MSPVKLLPISPVRTHRRRRLGDRLRRASARDHSAARKIPAYGSSPARQSLRRECQDERQRPGGIDVKEGMTMDPSSTRISPPLRLSCRIDPADVEKMLDTYDSGMCDISTANCISQVVARQLPFDRGIRLIRHNESRADLEIRGHRIPLSTELLKWLVAAETGRQVDPIEVVCNVPEAGPDATTIVRMAKAPSGLPSKKSAVPRKPARTRPNTPAPRPQSEMEATLRGIATPANLIHANESCPSGQKIRRRPEVEEYLQGY